MKNLTKTLTVLAVGLLSCGLFCQQAKAITGTVTFDGHFSTDHNNNFNNATKFTSFSGITVAFIPAPTGVYAGSEGSATTFKTFTFRPGLSPSPVVDQWSFSSGGNLFTFDLRVLDPVVSTKIFLSMSGTGTAEENGGQESAGTWTFSGNRNGGVLSFTATTVTVPDGGSAVALLGIALVGVEALRRKLKAC